MVKAIFIYYNMGLCAFVVGLARGWMARGFVNRPKREGRRVGISTMFHILEFRANKKTGEYAT